VEGEGQINALQSLTPNAQQQYQIEEGYFFLREGD
jgi:hypothetical protein